jgi:hypothetical protein
MCMAANARKRAWARTGAPGKGRVSEEVRGRRSSARKAGATIA